VRSEEEARWLGTLDDDPGADIQISHGRYRYFKIDEVEPLPDLEEAQS